MRVWVPVFFSLVMVGGMILGFELRDSLRSKRDIKDAIERNDRLEQVIDLIDEKYVDSVNTDNLYRDAISGILRSLDPHTVYIPAENLQAANEDLEGSFSGIGIEFSILRDTIAVTSVIEKGPASIAGLESGDRLIKVGDSTVAGVNINVDRISHLLRGKQRTKVLVTVKSQSSPALKQVVINRDLIPLHSVDAGIMANENTGYIKVTRFSATTHKEFSQALRRLKDEGAKQLIVDLRDNPGGYIGQSTSILDELIDGKKLLVYTQGSHSQKMEYKAEKEGLFEKGRVAILIDEGSASASEIVAGAIQDWDRGIIMGKRSFGKGLVQEPYEMTDGSEIRLTIAKYYTPSGRSIQRSFANGRDAYAADFEKRMSSSEADVDESVVVDTAQYYTANHRIVYGGGGIKPDVFVPYDSSYMLSGPLQNIIYSIDLKTAMWDYILANKERLRYKNIPDFESSFRGEEEIVKYYLSTLPAAERARVIKQLSIPKVNSYFALYIRAQVARFLFHDNGYYAVTIKKDNVVAKALEVICSNEYLKLISGK